MQDHKFRLGYVSALDGMRGIAVMLVLAFHAGVPLLQGGYIGVDIFFVLSGFLITSLLLNEFNERGRVNFKNFYIRRILRLLPALLVLLIALNLLGLIFSDAAGRANTLRASLSALFYVSNWVRAFNLYPLFYLSHTWSLAIEEQFYLLWPITLLFLLRLRLSRTKLLASVIALAIASWLWRIYLTSYGVSASRVYNGLDTRLDGLLLGCSLAIFMISFDLSSWKWMKNLITSKAGEYIAIAASIAILVICITQETDTPASFYWVIALVNFLSVILIFYFLNAKHSILKSFLQYKWLVFLGRISYGLYLWHFVIYGLIRDRLHLSWVGIFILGSIVSLIVSTLSYYFIERSALKLKSKFQTISGGRESVSVVESAPS